MKKNITVFLAILAVLEVSFVGCTNSSAPIMPKGELTAEQKEKIKKEDRAIEQEESQGSVKN